MRDFFRQCLNELEDRTGLRQLFFLKSQCANEAEFDKRVNIILDSMVYASKSFSYIPEESQQKYILRMMVEDQDYDHLDSRTVHKWLNLHKDKHMTTPKITEEEMTPAPPEVAEKYIEQFKEAVLKVGNPVIEVPSLEETKRVETGRSKFVIEGIEIYATSEAEAKKAYDATFK